MSESVRLSASDKNPGGWWIIAEPEVHFVPDQEVVVPDLAGWRRERMPAVPDDQRFLVTPDWVCEILSPSTARKDRTLKLPLYARYGVPHAWLVDPLHVPWKPSNFATALWALIATLSESDPVRVPPFDAVEFSLARFVGMTGFAVRAPESVTHDSVVDDAFAVLHWASGERKPQSVSLGRRPASSRRECHSNVCLEA